SSGSAASGKRNSSAAAGPPLLAVSSPPSPAASCPAWPSELAPPRGPRPGGEGGSPSSGRRAGSVAIPTTAPALPPGRSPRAARRALGGGQPRLRPGERSRGLAHPVELGRHGGALGLQGGEPRAGPGGPPPGPAGQHGDAAEQPLLLDGEPAQLGAGAATAPG